MYNMFYHDLFNEVFYVLASSNLIIQPGDEKSGHLVVTSEKVTDKVTTTIEIDIGRTPIGVMVYVTSKPKRPLIDLRRSRVIGREFFKRLDERVGIYRIRTEHLPENLVLYHDNSEPMTAPEFPFEKYKPNPRPIISFSVANGIYQVFLFFLFVGYYPIGSYILLVFALFSFLGAYAVFLDRPKVGALCLIIAGWCLPLGFFAIPGVDGALYLAKWQESIQSTGMVLPDRRR